MSGELKRLRHGSEEQDATGSIDEGVQPGFLKIPRTARTLLMSFFGPRELARMSSLVKSWPVLDEHWKVIFLRQGRVHPLQTPSCWRSLFEHPLNICKGSGVLDSLAMFPTYGIGACFPFCSTEHHVLFTECVNSVPRVVNLHIFDSQDKRHLCSVPVDESVRPKSIANAGCWSVTRDWIVCEIGSLHHKDGNYVSSSMIAIHVRSGEYTLLANYVTFVEIGPNVSVIVARNARVSEGSIFRIALQFEYPNILANVLWEATRSSHTVACRVLQASMASIDSAEILAVLQRNLVVDLLSLDTGDIVRSVQALNPSVEHASERECPFRMYWRPISRHVLVCPTGYITLSDETRYCTVARFRVAATTPFISNGGPELSLHTVEQGAPLTISSCGRWIAGVRHKHKYPPEPAELFLLDLTAVLPLQVVGLEASGNEVLSLDSEAVLLGNPDYCEDRPGFRRFERRLLPHLVKDPSSTFLSNARCFSRYFESFFVLQHDNEEPASLVSMSVHEAKTHKLVQRLQVDQECLKELADDWCSVHGGHEIDSTIRMKANAKIFMNGWPCVHGARVYFSVQCGGRVFLLRWRFDAGPPISTIGVFSEGMTAVHACRRKDRLANFQQ